MIHEAESRDVPWGTDLFWAEVNNCIHRECEIGVHTRVPKIKLLHTGIIFAIHKNRSLREGHPTPYRPSAG